MLMIILIFLIGYDDLLIGYDKLLTRYDELPIGYDKLLTRARASTSSLHIEESLVPRRLCSSRIAMISSASSTRTAIVKRKPNVRHCQKKAKIVKMLKCRNCQHVKMLKYKHVKISKCQYVLFQL